jgi:hypothetical protein
MGEWTRKRPLLALVAFHQQALYVYISPCGAQHRALRPGRAAAGRGSEVIPRGRSCSPWPQRS